MDWSKLLQEEVMNRALRDNDSINHDVMDTNIICSFHIGT